MPKYKKPTVDSSKPTESPVTDLNAAIDAAHHKAAALGLLIAALERKTRDPAQLATLARLSVAVGEFRDRLHSTTLDSLAALK